MQIIKVTSDVVNIVPPSAATCLCRRASTDSAAGGATLVMSMQSVSLTAETIAASLRNKDRDIKMSMHDLHNTKHEHFVQFSRLVL